MMEDEILRQKYIRLRTKLQNIRSRISKLNSLNTKLINAIDGAVLIDGKTIDENKINYISRETRQISSEISNTIIPNINRKI